VPTGEKALGQVAVTCKGTHRGIQRGSTKALVMTTGGFSGPKFDIVLNLIGTPRNVKGINTCFERG